MAATVNLRIDQGTSFSTDITVFNHTGETFDLTGFTASAKMAQGYASTRTRTIFTTTIDNDPTSGVITLKLSTTQTSALEAPKRYVFDVEIQKTSDNTVTRVIEGIITVSPSVTI